MNKLPIPSEATFLEFSAQSGRDLFGLFRQLPRTPYAIERPDVGCRA